MTNDQPIDGTSGADLTDQPVPVREVPNPRSTLLAAAAVTGVALGLPSDLRVPPGFGAIVLVVPIEQLKGKSLIAIQRDLGLPWSPGAGHGVWLAL